YKSFITRTVSEDFGMNKAEQAALLNKSLDFFKENTEISLDNFAKEVIQKPEMIESFNQYKEQYEKEHEIEIGDTFKVSESAVKKQARKFKSVIKLDKNFHIYVHGDEHLIEQGEDKDGWKYYKIFYREES
ncbi:MAG: nucleoid-associated protein, partial [Bacteroidia bacterium]|nr:nucleoid-associated protein [Bacteroidia bacterium]